MTGGAPRDSVPLTAIVIAQNCADAIGACVSSLSFAAEVLVVDGGSVDGTAEVAERLGARVVSNPWAGFAAQRRFGLAHASQDWVFACDSDERVPPALAAEVAGVVARAGTALADGFRVRRRNQFLGAWMDVGPWARDWQLRLFRRSAARVTDASVHEGYAVDGAVASLAHPLLHLTHATLAQSVSRMNLYTSLEAVDRAARRRVGPLDALLLPAGVFVNYYVAKGCWRSGVRGFLLAATTAMYKSVLYLKLRVLQDAGGGRARA